ncbi:MAG: hypothetical protein VX000_05425, partial [Myxococcota bacterium]|nr:hypothetical protein [Myxococcota bacterium]
MPAVLHPFANRSAHPARGRSYRCTAFLVRLGLIALVASGAPAAQAGDLTRFAELPPAPAKPRTLHRAGPIKVNGLEQRIPGAPSNLRVLGRVVNESVEDGAMGPRYNYDVELRFTNYGSHAVSFTLPPGQATFLDQRITIDQCINTDTIGYPQDPRKRNHVILARGESVTLVERIQNFASVCQDIRVRPTHVKLHYGAYVDECLRDFPGTLKSARQKQAAGDFEGALSTLVGGHQAHGCSGRVGRRSELREQAEALFIELKQQREGAAEDARAAKARRDEALRYIQRGDDKMAREDITGAIRDYERALEIDPDTAAQSRLQRAESALAARRQAEARKREEMEQKRADDVRKATLDRHLTRFDEAMAAGDLNAARTALSAAESAGLSASEASTRRTAIRTRAAELQRAAADLGTEARSGGSRDATATPGGGDAGA